MSGREVAAVVDGNGRVWIEHGRPVPPIAAHVLPILPQMVAARVLAITPTHVVAEFSYHRAAGPLLGGQAVSFAWWAYTAAELGIGGAVAGMGDRMDNPAG